MIEQLLILSSLYTIVYCLDLERYEEFPPYVSVQSFRPLGNEEERNLRKAISYAVQESLISMLEGQPGRILPGLGGMQTFPPDSMMRGMFSNLGIKINPIDSNRQPYGYRVLKKIHQELLERNITFVCQITGFNDIISFEKLDPYGRMPYAIFLQKV